MADQEWAFREFAAPDGAQQMAQFLNEAGRQGTGEASATLRDDGSASVIYLSPGSLGTSTSPTWVATTFTAPNGAAEAARYLNEDFRQGPGEASATVRDDGGAGLIHLGPAGSARAPRRPGSPWSSPVSTVLRPPSTS